MTTRAAVLVTRPAREAARWLHALQTHGIHACALPLIGIAPLTTPALNTARAQWQHYQAVMFVSAQAVQHFFDNAPRLTHGNTRLWAPGPGTAAALLRKGLPAHCMDSPPAHAAQFDSEALWRVVAGQIHPGTRVLIVRGSDSPLIPQGTGRRWLAQQLLQAGATVDCVAAYQRCAPQFTPEQCAQASQAATNGSLWLFSSAQAITHLQAALPQQSWQHARALTTHPRIAQAAHAAKFGSIHTCRPALADVLTALDEDFSNNCGTMPT